jgi:release factor glutamine methyltransferase
VTAEPATVSGELRRASEHLRGACVPDGMMDARILAAAAFGLTREDMLLEPHRPVDFDAQVRFRSMIDRRCAREPVARIIGAREFRSLDFLLGPETLEPRPDSETIVEVAIEYGQAFPGAARVLDLGTGTGCLLLSVISELPDATGIGSDIAAGAVETASRNADSLGLADRVRFVCTDWTDGIDGPFDLVLSNPPYITTAEIAGLAPEVAMYDPPSALDGGADGLDAYRALACRVGSVLSPSSVVVLEIGAGQEEDVTAIFEAGGFRLVGTRADLGGHTRALSFGIEPLSEWLTHTLKKGWKRSDSLLGYFCWTGRNEMFAAS